MTGLGAGRDFQFGGTMDGGHVCLAAEGRLDHGDGETEVNGLTITLKMLVIVNVNHDIEIAGRTAPATAFPFTGQSHPRPGVHPGGNADIDLFTPVDESLAIAILTGFRNDLAGAMTVRTGSRNLKKALGTNHLSASMTGRTCLWLVSGSGT